MRVDERRPSRERTVRREGASGFSLTEASIFGALISVIASAVLSTLPTLMHAGRNAHRAQQANALLRHVLAEIESVDYANLGSLDQRVVDEQALSGTQLAHLEGFEARLAVVQMSAVLRKVEVRIVYRDPGVRDATELVLARTAVHRGAR